MQNPLGSLRQKAARINGDSFDERAFVRDCRFPTAESKSGKSRKAAAMSTSRDLGAREARRSKLILSPLRSKHFIRSVPQNIRRFCKLKLC